MRPEPTTARGRRTREKIVTTAARLMHERGLGGTPLEDVLAESGTGKSQLYHYFGGKQDLAVAVLEHQLARVLAAQPSLQDETCTDLRRWRDEVLAAARESQYGNCPLGAFVGQVDDDAELRATLARLFERWQDAITGLVRRARAAGEIAPGTSAEDLALTLLTAQQGGTALSHLRGSPDALARALDDVLDRHRAPGVTP
ncbi:TetR family transcriptional regulator C-terminal domain-containing protein [Amycolatopsis sp. NPDC051903]|uniref:TetR family transcriptional regulator C-terminal domain-containing protein n=1 Tax=Amycolatopsis sp. NPDC051903 TaxID=3363936 RepID=UPI003787EE24